MTKIRKNRQMEPEKHFSDYLVSETKQRRRLDLVECLRARRAEYIKKWERARNDDKLEYWWEKARSLYKILNRHDTIFSLMVTRNQAYFGDPLGVGFMHARDHAQAVLYWESWVKARKDTGLLRFETSYTYSMWFMSNSTSADYGTYACDRCGRTFHHSPSTISRAAKEIHSCCCGYCTNEIVVFPYPGITAYVQ